MKTPVARREQQVPPAPNPSPAPAQPVVLVATGEDHPGILEEVSRYIIQHKGRIDATRVGSLGGRVALLVLFQSDADAVTNLRSDLQVLSERTGIRVTIEPASAAFMARQRTSRFRLEAIGGRGIDKSALLLQTTNLLRVLKINIVEVTTGPGAVANPMLPPRPDDGMAARLELDVPRDVPITKLRELLGQLLDPLKVTWELSVVTEDRPLQGGAGI